MYTYFNLIKHPFFVYLIICILSCLPNKPKILVYNDLPLKGDNFKNVSNQTVYYYDGIGKYTYTSIECFFSLGNPDFSTTYEYGGIKCINDELAEKIPLLGKMCDSTSSKFNEISNKVKPKPPLKTYFDRSVLLDKFSKIAHFLSYSLLALSLMFYKRTIKKPIMILFICLVAGGILEFIQEFFIPGRNFSIEDIVYNILGSTLGIMLFYIFSKIKDLDK